MVNKYVALTIGLLALTTIAVQLGYTPTPCTGNITDAYCSGDTQIQTTCQNGYIKKTRIDCGVCRDGACLPENCDTSQKEYAMTCGGFKNRVIYECFDNDYLFTTSPCGEGEACKDGLCVDSNYNEDWALNSWSRYSQQVSESPELQAYLNCRDVFDCDTIQASRLVDEINQKYTPTTPKEFINAASDHIHKLITYDYPGGLSQCGEKASDIIKLHEENDRVRGNCVDYSTVMVAVLRARGIPARQVAGCVTIDAFCERLSITPQKTRIGLGVCGDNVCGLNEDSVSCPQDCGDKLRGDGFAHAYLEAWTPELGFQTVDPTVDTGLASCVGYMKKGESTPEADIQQCYLPLGVTC